MIGSYDDRRYLANLLGALAVAIADLQGEAVDAPGRPRADAEALLAIHSHPRATVGDVASTTGLSHSGAVRVLDRLTDLGWIRRTPGADRRTVELQCTPAGTRQAHRLLESRHRAMRTAVSGLSDVDAASLQGIVETILASLPEGRAAAWRICRLCDHQVCRSGVCPVREAIS